MLCGSNGLWNVQYLLGSGQVWAGTRQVTCSTAQHGPACPHPLHTAAFLHPPPFTPPGQILIPLPAGGDILPGTHLRMRNISFRNLKTCHHSLKVAACLILPPEQFVPPATCAGVYPPLTGGLVRAARSGHWAQWSSRSW